MAEVARLDPAANRVLVDIFVVVGYVVDDHVALSPELFVVERVDCAVHDVFSDRKAAHSRAFEDVQDMRFELEFI